MRLGRPESPKRASYIPIFFSTYTVDRRAIKGDIRCSCIRYQVCKWKHFFLLPFFVCLFVCLLLLFACNTQVLLIGCLRAARAFSASPEKCSLPLLFIRFQYYTRLDTLTKADTENVDWSVSSHRYDSIPHRNWRGQRECRLVSVKSPLW